jgi:hypothetical protein
MRHAEEGLERRAARVFLGAGVDGGEDLLELVGRVHEPVAVLELGVDQVAVHDHLEGAGVGRGGLTHALGRGVLGLDSILHLLVLGGVACARRRGGTAEGSVSCARVSFSAERSTAA